MLGIILSRRIINRRHCVPGYSSCSRMLREIASDNGQILHIHGQTAGKIDINGSWKVPIAWISSCKSVWSNLQVKVPPLGESITDGTVAAVLKQAGDLVEEDEPLIQIETDKVTVDVRTPVAGKVKSILVSPDESVEVNHVIAVIEEGEAPGRVETADPTDSIPQKASGKNESSSSPSSTGRPGLTAELPMEERQTSTGRAHVPLISFPSRRTADGRVISDLSEGEQMQIRNDEVAAMHSAAFFRKNIVQIEPVFIPPRKELSEKEMEMIMLGGAE